MAEDLVGSGKSTRGDSFDTAEPARDPKPEPESRPEPGGNGGGGSPAGGGPRLPNSSAANRGAGFLLGVLFWAWVGLPFLKGGPQQVSNTLKAKFFNKAPDGSWLP